MRYSKVTTSADTLRSYVTNMPPKEYKGISPSSLGGCHRSHYWKILGVPASTPPNYGALVNFQVGHAWERVIADAYKDQGTLVKWFQDGQDEPLTDPETMLAGTPDLIIKEGDNQIVVDSKTVNSAWFRYNQNYQSMDDWVAKNRQYVFQQVAYVHLARKAGYDVDSAILSFASKDDGYIGMEFRIDVTDDELQTVLSRALRLKRYLEAKELPPCTCEGWQVGYCNYGNPATQAPNKKKKIVNTECCDPSYALKEE